MKWEELHQNQKIVSILTILVALLHLFGSGGSNVFDFVDPISLRTGFLINGIGYLIILYFLYFSNNRDPSLFRVLLTIWTIGSIFGWAMLHPEEDLLDESLATKFVEILILIFLYLDEMNRGRPTPTPSVLPS